MSIKDVYFQFTEMIPYGYILQNKYFVSFLIIILFSLLGKVVLVIFNKYLASISAKTKTKFDDMLFAHTKNPIFYLVLAFGIKFSLLNLGLDGVVTKIVNSVMATVLVLIVTRVFDVFVETWGILITKKTKVDVGEVIIPIIHKTITVIFVVISGLWILKIWSINIAPYLAGVGISGLVLGLALQDSLKNVFGGLSLIMDKNFNIGDPVRLDSGELGKIKEIGLRSTKILTFDHEVIFIPNGQLANMKIHNYVKPNTKIRKIVEFSVVYGTEIEKVKSVILKEMKKVDDLYDDPYMDVIFVKMGDNGLHFLARFFVDWDNAYKKWVEVTEVIYDTLKKLNINIPFPTRTVYMVNQGKK